MLYKELVESILLPSLSRELKVEADKIDHTVSLAVYGLDSSSAITITGDLWEELGIPVEPDLFYNYPTVEKAVKYLSECMYEEAKK